MQADQQHQRAPGTPEAGREQNYNRPRAFSILIAALHHTMRDHFDMDKIFEMLDKNNKTRAFSHSPWPDDPQHRSAFVFTLKHFTIVGDGSVPMAWQKVDKASGGSETHVPISKCSSIIASSLEAMPIAKIRHKCRRKPFGRREGDIYDPSSPWHVLSMQAWPNWKSLSIHTILRSTASTALMLSS